MRVDVTDTHLEIRFKYHPNLIKKVKTIKGLWFNGNKGDKHWRGPVKPSIISALDDLGFEIYGYGEEPPELRIKAFYENPPWRDIKINDTSDLWPFQIESLQFLYWRKGRGLIGHSPGLGKTRIGMAWIRENPKEHGPALIICPVSVKYQWETFWEDWIGTPVTVLESTTPYKIPRDITVVINWDILNKWYKYLSSRNFKTLIGDESQALGSLYTGRTMAFRTLSKVLPFVIPMSGSPIRSKRSQIFPTLNILDPVVYKSRTAFEKRYCETMPTEFGSIEVACDKHTSELYEIMTQVMFRKEKREVMKDLPPLMPITIVPMPVSEVDYFNMEDEAIAAMEAAQNKTEEDIALEKLFWSVYDLKKDMVVKWIEDFLSTGRKLILGAYHKEVIKSLRKSFPRISVHIDGGVSASQRVKVKEQFLGNKQLLIFQILSAVGTDGLQTVCSDMAVVELPWAWTDMDQFIGRTDRPGQTEPVNVSYLLSPDTTDDHKLRVLNRSEKTFKDIIEGKSTKEFNARGNFLKALKEKHKARKELRK